MVGASHSSSPSDENNSKRRSGNSPPIIRSAPIVNSNSNAKCIYLSGFTPKTSVSDILNHVGAIGIPNSNRLNCKKLVSANRNQEKLTFVSFKLCAPLQLVEAIRKSSNWPSHITVRDFVEKPRTNNNYSGKSNAQTTKKNFNTPKKTYSTQPFKYNSVPKTQSKKNTNQIDHSPPVQHQLYFQQQQYAQP